MSLEGLIVLIKGSEAWKLKRDIVMILFTIT